MEAAARLSESNPPAVTFEDGLGQRSRIADPTGEPGREVLTLRPSFATVPSFEFALRERTGRLATFRHAYYARVRGVERTSGADPRLRVISDAGQGLRLSNLLAGAQARRVPIDINAALCVIRQLVPAVAMLHESARDVAHGAIAPERLLVSSQARLLIVEYVLGAALEQLRYTRERYWTELRIPLPPSTLAPRFDHRCDVTQIGVVALSLILGRPLRPDEFPDRIADVVASTWAVSPRGGFEPLPPGLRGWLARALQLDANRSFQSAVEARAELDTVLGDSELLAAPASLEAFLTRYHQSEAPPVEIHAAPKDRGDGWPSGGGSGAAARVTSRFEATAPDDERGGGAAGSGAADVPGATLTQAAEHTVRSQFAALDERLTGNGADRPVARAESKSADVPVSRVTPALPESTDGLEQVYPIATATAGVMPDREADAPFSFDTVHGSDREPSPFGPDDGAAAFSRRWWKNWRVIGAAVAVVVVIAAGSSIGARRPAAEPEVHAASGTLEVSTSPAGAQAIIDGQLRGVTPLVLALEPGTHALELRGAGEPRTIPVTINPGTKVSQYVELSAAPGTARASSDPRPPEPAAGGATLNTVEPPHPAAPPSVVNGTLTVNSPIDLQVFENGILLGNTRGRLALAPGPHELELVNADLGVRSIQSVQVSAAKAATVLPVLPNGTLSLNAVPWADVWLDGERVGETPLGNLSVRVGTHDVVFRHPELGERHQTVVVSAKEPARLSVTMQGR